MDGRATKSRKMKILFFLGFMVLLSPQARGENPASTPPPSLSEAVARAATPNDVVGLMRKEFSFVEDARLFGTADYWQKPEELWRRKSGDCEDFALFAQYALARHGIESYVVSFYGINHYAHTVTVFKQNGKYNVINQDRLYDCRAPSLEAALSHINPRWIWGGIARQNGNRGRMIRKLQHFL